MAHLVTQCSGQFLVLQEIQSHWAFHLLLDEDSKAIYSTFWSVYKFVCTFLPHLYSELTAVVFLLQHPRDWLVKNILHSSIWAPLYSTGLACGIPHGKALYGQAGGTHLQYATLSPKSNVISAMLGWTGKTPAAARVGSAAALRIQVARSP